MGTCLDLCKLTSIRCIWISVSFLNCSSKASGRNSCSRKSGNPKWSILHQDKSISWVWRLCLTAAYQTLCKLTCIISSARLALSHLSGSAISERKSHRPRSQRMSEKMNTSGSSRPVISLCISKACNTEHGLLKAASTQTQMSKVLRPVLQHCKSICFWWIRLALHNPLFSMLRCSLLTRGKALTMVLFHKTSSW